jgi:hypothetical protein
MFKGSWRKKRKILIISLTPRIHIFILHKENMTDLHVYTYIHTYTKIIHTHPRTNILSKEKT